MIQKQDLRSPQNAPWTPRSAAMTMGSFSVRSAVVRTSARWDKSACVTRKSLPGFADSFFLAVHQENVYLWCICWILKRVLLVAIGGICENMWGAKGAPCISWYCLRYAAWIQTVSLWITSELSKCQWWNGTTQRNEFWQANSAWSFRPTVPLRYIIQQELPGIIQHRWALIRPSETSLLCIVIIIWSYHDILPELFYWSFQHVQTHADRRIDLRRLIHGMINLWMYILKKYHIPASSWCTETWVCML